MTIRASSWHYRLWTHIIHDQSLEFVGTWFAERYSRSGIPSSLCPYVNRLFAYFFIQIPTLIVAGTLLTLPLILGPMQWFITGNFLPDFQTEIPVALVFVIWALYVAAAAGFFLCMVWFQGKMFLEKYFVLPTVPGAAKVGRVVTDTAEIAGAYYDAFHSKVCPMLDVVQDDETDKE